MELLARPSDPAAHSAIPGLPPGTTLLQLGQWLLTQAPETVVQLVGDDQGVLETFEHAVNLARTSISHDARLARWRSDPASLMHHLSGGSYQLYSHIRLLSAKFVEAVEGRDVRQLWNLPSQTGKTTLLMACVLWALDQDPTLRIMYVSYDADKAVREAGEALDIARLYEDQLRFSLRPDIQARGRWNTRQGGGLYATGIGGRITGYPADIELLDDLIKGWEAAHSETVRNRTWNIYLSQLRMRLQSERNPIVMAGTRWHEDDPSGRALKSQGDDVQHWTLIRIPHLAEVPDPKAEIPEMRQPDPLGREPGEPLEKFSLVEVLARARSLGSYLAAGLEQQRPAPEEGGELKRAWWRWHTALPPAFDDAISSWDTTFKAKEAGDYVVGQVWGRTGADFWMAEQFRGHWGQGMTKLGIALCAIRHPYVTRHYVENTGNGPEVIAELRAGQKDYVITDEQAGGHGMTEVERAAVQALMRRGLAGVLPVNPKGDKQVRARAESGLLEGGSCHLIEGDPGALALVNEAAAFPNGANDDMVDAWSQAMSKLARGHASVQASSGQVPNARASAMPARTSGLPGAGRGLPAGPALGRFTGARSRPPG